MLYDQMPPNAQIAQKGYYRAKRKQWCGEKAHKDGSPVTQIYYERNAAEGSTSPVVSKVL